MSTGESNAALMNAGASTFDHGDEPGAAGYNMLPPLRTDMHSSLAAKDQLHKTTTALPDPAGRRPQEFRARSAWVDADAPGWAASAKNALLSSRLNLLLLFIPCAWVAHFENVAGHWSYRLTFAFCFLSITALNKTIDWCGKQTAPYLGRGLGDLLVITSPNIVDGILSIVLLCKCELRLLQSLIIGVIVLHLILIPGTAFLAGGALVWEQQLHEHNTQLNRSLLAIGVLAIFLPTTFFAALDRGAQSAGPTGVLQPSGNVVTDDMRTGILTMSRGLAIILIVVYVCCRLYLHRPPPQESYIAEPPEDQNDNEEKPGYGLRVSSSEMGPWACAVVLAVALGLTATTTVFLVESIDRVMTDGHIPEEWFGLVLLPLASFSADGTVLLLFFAKAMFHHIAKREPLAASDFAQARSIDVSIQFVLFWMPFIVLLGWWTDKPMHLLFDFYELAVVAGSCMLLNYVTADMKTNWIEGFILIGFYTMIAVSTWYYVGQSELALMLSCPESIGRGGLVD